MLKSFDMYIKENNVIHVQEPLNEGLFSFIGKMIGKAKQAIAKTKGGKEVEAIYQEELKKITEEISKKAKVDLNLNAEEQLAKQKEKEQPKPKNESILNEADEPKINMDEVQTSDSQVGGDTDTKLDAKTLLQKSKLIDDIVNVHTQIALKRMNNVLQKFGGAEKNPKLAIIIDNKKDEFKLAILNAKISYLEQSGDKTSAQKMAVERDKMAKALDTKWSNFEKTEYAEIQVDGVKEKIKLAFPYRYKGANGIKPIKVIRKGEKPGEVIAVYMVGDSKDKEQVFNAKNIEINFKPEKNKKYYYYSNTNDAEIRVEVVGDVDKENDIKVKSGKSEFTVKAGTLYDEKITK